MTTRTRRSLAVAAALLTALSVAPRAGAEERHHDGTARHDASPTADGGRAGQDHDGSPEKPAAHVPAAPEPAAHHVPGLQERGPAGPERTTKAGPVTKERRAHGTERKHEGDGTGAAASDEAGPLDPARARDRALETIARLTDDLARRRAGIETSDKLSDEVKARRLAALDNLGSALDKAAAAVGGAGDPAAVKSALRGLHDEMLAARRSHVVTGIHGAQKALARITAKLPKLSGALDVAADGGTDVVQARAALAAASAHLGTASALLAEASTAAGSVEAGPGQREAMEVVRAKVRAAKAELRLAREALAEVRRSLEAARG